MKTPVSSPASGPAKHGILDAATKHDSGEWTSGITFSPDNCIAGMSAEALCNGAISSPTISGCATDVDFEPYVVSATVKRPIGSYSEAELSTLATDALKRSEGAIIEKVSAEGLTGVTMPFLADATTTLVSATATPLRDALGQLQEALVLHGEVTLWVPNRLSQYLDTVVEGDDGRLFTRVRNDLVVVGNYGIEGPGASANATGANGWVFATAGQPDLYLSPVDVSVGIDEVTNERVARAERIAAVTWLICGQSAILAKGV